MLPRLPAPAADNFAVHPPQRGDAPSEVFDGTAASFADGAADRRAPAVGRDEGEGGGGGPGDGRLGSSPGGLGGGLGGLGPGIVEEEGGGARVGVGVLRGGVEA